MGEAQEWNLKQKTTQLREQYPIQRNEALSSCLLRPHDIYDYAPKHWNDIALQRLARLTANTAAKLYIMKMILKNGLSFKSS